MHNRTSSLFAAILRQTPAVSTAALTLLAGVSARPANAAPYTYTGGSSGTVTNPINGGSFSSGFNDGTNNGVSPPINDPTTALNFGGSSSYTANDNLSSLTVNSLNFSNSAPMILSSTNTNNSITFSGTAPTVNLNNSGSVTINASLYFNLAANTTFVGSGSATISSLIKGSGYGLTLGTGTSPFTGTLTLGGSNSYTGATTINGGTLSISSLTLTTVSNGIGKSSASAGNLVLNGGTLQFTGASSGTTDRLFTLGANGGTLDASGSAPVNFKNMGAVAFSSSNQRQALTLTGTNTAGNTLAVIVGDNGLGLTSLTKNGVGTWVLTSTNTYTGGTTVNGGTLTVGNGSGSAATLGSGALAVNNTSTGASATNVVIDFNAAQANQTVSGLSSTVSGTSGNTATVMIESGNTLTDNQSGTTNYAGSVSGAGTLNINGQGAGSGSALVNYTGSDSAGQTNVGTNATLALNDPTGVALSGPVAVATGGALRLDADNQIASTSSVTLNGGTLNANGHSDGAINGTDPTKTAVTSQMGTLTLGAGMTSTLDFGAAQTGSGPFVLAFADSSGTLSGTGKLNLVDYTGGVDALYIGTSADLSGSQLQQIAINGMGVTQLGNGEIVLSASPEPSSLVSSLLGAGALGGLICLRRRAA